ncbi:MAG TPA: NUDIX domain-containing protein [Candidatus Limnocylindrales bacterium]|nr:NUDIX domain-containing protein [Candidatus Limnocylindrales bacterium]
MARESAGLLLHRRRNGAHEVLLVHPGGPFWTERMEGAWSIPKGEVAPGEPLLAVALREFEEELGAPPPQTALVSLGSVRQAGGKVVHGFGAAGDFDVSRLRSNTFDLEWPPRSGKIGTFPEVDQAAWFGPESARRMLLPAQRPFIDRLLAVLTPP